MENGWFIGYVEKSAEQYIVILNFSDLKEPDTDAVGGARAKMLAKEIVTELGLF